MKRFDIIANAFASGLTEDQLPSGQHWRIIEPLRRVAAPSRCRRWGHCVVWCVSALLIGYDALAEARQPVQLVYQAPSECPDLQSVLERTSTLVRHQPPVPISATAIISQDSSGYRLQLRIEGGTQSFVSPSCESLIKTLTIVLALAVDPVAREFPAPDEPHALPGEQTEQPRMESGSSGAGVQPGAASQATTRPLLSVSPADSTVHPTPIQVRRKHTALEATTKNKPHSVRPTPRVREPEPVSASRALEVHPSALLITEYGMLPHFAHGPGLGVWVDRGAWSLGATAIWLVPDWAQMPDVDQVRGGHISFLGGDVDLCRAFLRSRLIRACVGIEAGDMMGKGSGVSNSQIGHGLWLAPTAGIALRPKFWSKMGADLRLGFALPVKRPAFGFDGFTWRFEPHAWSIRLASGFSWL